MRSPPNVSWQVSICDANDVHASDPGSSAPPQIPCALHVSPLRRVRHNGLAARGLRNRFGARFIVVDAEQARPSLRQRVRRLGAAEPHHVLPAALALDERGVGEVEATHLPYTVRDLE